MTRKDHQAPQSQPAHTVLEGSALPRPSRNFSHPKVAGRFTTTTGGVVWSC